MGMENLFDSEPEDGTEIATDKGEWHADFTTNINGTAIIDLDIDGTVMLMGLPQHHGWRGINSVSMNHQVRIEEINEWIESNSLCREVAALAVDTGEWETLWTRENETPTGENR